MQRFVYVTEPGKFSDAIRRTALGSQASIDRHHAQMRDLRAVQKVAVAVAPDTTLEVVRDGKALLLLAGMEVQPTDIIHGNPARVVLDKLRDFEAVLVVDHLAARTAWEASP